MVFPSPGDEVYYNEAGEPLGWSKPASAADYYCEWCGFSHGGECPTDVDIDDDEEYDAPIGDARTAVYGNEA